MIFAKIKQPSNAKFVYFKHKTIDTAVSVIV